MSNEPAQNLSPPASQTRAAHPLSPSANRVTEVTVTDIDMPFVSMMSFMVKWTLAAIPAFFILAVVGAVFWGIVGAIFR